jgi:tRNA(Ile)-lysidine synthase TilS/MesJ
MVIAKILRLLQLHRPQLRIRSILAMHIDYGNRPESAQEAAYVRRWCEGDPVQGVEGTSTGASDGAGAGAATSSAMLGGLQCRVRRVDEVTRGVTSRDEYEKVSRDIRYGFYRTCTEEVAQQQREGEGLVSGVIFGHHLGDVQENVISNVMRCVQCQLKHLLHLLSPTFPTLQRVRTAAAVRYDCLLRY